MNAKRMSMLHFHSPKIPARLAASFGLLALLLGGCQSQDGLTADRAGDKRNMLATALAVPPAKFADGVVSQGFNTPMAMEFAPDGRLFVLEKSGAVKISQGASAALTFLTLNVDQNTERGLLGIAFDPQWATQKYVYIHYSRPGANANRVSRFTVSAGNPNAADPASEVALFDLSPLISSAYHNGGGLHFGADGFLYVTCGDNRLPGNAQNSSVLLGKILRFSKVPSGTSGIPTIPTDNPFYNTYSGNNRAIWGFGLRNPFTFAVQPGTGRIFINDVGEDGYEEINDATSPGQNFGWPLTEGPTTAGGITGPIGGYVNGSGVNGDDCAIVGATFYNPPAGAQQFPSGYLGDYFYGDHCSAYIKTVDLSAPSSPTTFATALGGHLMDLKVGPEGAIYYLTLEGLVGKISYTGTDLPSISRQPATQTVSVNQSVTFSVEANGGGLAYQWQKNGANIAGATGTSISIAGAQLADNGSQYKVIVTNSFGSATSNVATLTVITNQPPAPVITAPAAGSKFSGGQWITYTGTATDPEDGVLPASAFTWWVELMHDTHTHPFIAAHSGIVKDSFQVPTVNETAPGIAYRIYLQVKDSKGLTTTVTQVIQPNTVSITLNTVPSGLQFNLDGQPKTSPLTFTGVVGIQRQLEAVSPQTLGGVNYSWSNWSDGQAQSHVILTPAANTVYTATFVSVGGPIAVPGRIQAEDYRTGGEGVAYHDADVGNTGTQYRADGVDIEATTDAGGGYNVGWTAAGEWLEYNINVAATGSYALTARMASAAAGTKTATVTVDGAPKGTFNSTDASGWQSWKDIVVPGVSLTAGSHVLRITMTTGNFNLNYLNAAAEAVNAIGLPGRIQAEAYKAGGENVGYHDLTTGNTGNQYRTDNVDIEATTDAGGGYNVGWIDAGEWLAYDVNVASAGAYTLTARLASGVAGTKTVAVTLDGGTAPIATFSFSDASGWQSWKDVVLTGITLPAGSHVLRFTMPNGNLNLNYADVAAGSAPNLLLNGDFANGIVNWQTYFAAPATGAIANEAGSARITITNQGANPWDIQIFQPTALTAGKAYTLDFDLKSEATPKSFRVVVEHNGDPWTKYSDLPYTVTAAANTYQHFTITWTQSAADAGGRVVFDFGFANVNDCWLDNVSLK